MSSSQVNDLGDFKLCVGGFATSLKLIYGDKGVGIHRVRFRQQAIWWDEKGHGYEFILDRDRARRCFYCRLCGRYQGCTRCLETNLLSEIECSKCGEYANEVGFWMYGNVNKDKQENMTVMQAFVASQKKNKDLGQPRMFYRCPNPEEIKKNIEAHVPYRWLPKPPLLLPGSSTERR